VEKISKEENCGVQAVAKSLREANEHGKRKAQNLVYRFSALAFSFRHIKLAFC